MNKICEQFPVFENVFEAIDFLRSLGLNAVNIPDNILPYFDAMDPLNATGLYLDETDFLVTRLQCNVDVVEDYRQLNIGNSIPFLTDFKRYSIKPNLAHTQFLYRGQSKDYKSIKPNLFRDKNKHYFLDDMIKGQELIAFIAEHPLVQLLGIKGFELRNRNIKLQANLYGLAQHYYNRTTEVDLSSSIDVAAFFAVTMYDAKLDKYLPIEAGPESTGVIYALPVSRSLAYNSIFGFNITSIGKQFCFERPSRQLGFLADCSGDKDLIDHKLLLRVEFKHNCDITNRIYDFWGKGDAIAPEDPLEKYWRMYRDNPGEPFHVSNKAIELNLYHNHGETEESITDKLLSYRNGQGAPAFKLTGKEWPEFPRELLEGYWSDIKNGWWQDVFCDDIYFPLSGNKTKEALKAIPNDPRYRSSFFEN